MKKFLSLLLLLFCVATASADTYFEIDNYEVPRARVGSFISVPVKAHFSGRVSAWQIYFTLPDGLSLRRASSTSQMTIHFTDMFGEPDSIRPGVSTGSIPTVLSFVSAQGYWDPDGDEEYETYGVVKWEAGDYDHFFTLHINVSSEFKGGEIVLKTIPSSGNDTRGGTIKETGDDGKSFFTTTIFTLEPPMPGDVDGNGSLSIADASLLIDYLLGQEVEGISPEAADVDGNGIVSIADISAIIDLLVNQ